MAAHKQTAPPPNLLDALECTICLDTPVSPIHECDNGHIVCGVCAERMTECGMCKTKLQISKLAERLSRQVSKLNFSQSWEIIINNLSSV